MRNRDNTNIVCDVCGDKTEKYFRGLEEITFKSQNEEEEMKLNIIVPLSNVWLDVCISCLIEGIEIEMGLYEDIIEDSTIRFGRMIEDIKKKHPKYSETRATREALRKLRS